MVGKQCGQFVRLARQKRQNVGIGWRGRWRSAGHDLQYRLSGFLPVIKKRCKAVIGERMLVERGQNFRG